jgi:hypothetical protein
MNIRSLAFGTALGLALAVGISFAGGDKVRKASEIIEEGLQLCDLDDRISHVHSDAEPWVVDIDCNPPEPNFP